MVRSAIAQYRLRAKEVSKLWQDSAHFHGYFGEPRSLSEAVAHLVPQFVITPRKPAINLPQMRQPILVRQRELPEPVQEFQVLVSRIEVSEHKELVDAAVLNGKGVRVQKMPELGAPYLPVARHA